MKTLIAICCLLRAARFLFLLGAGSMLVPCSVAQDASPFAVRAFVSKAVFAPVSADISIEFSRQQDPVGDLTLTERLPVGWIFDSVVSGPIPATAPAPGTIGQLIFKWAGPAIQETNIVYRVRFAPGHTADGEISGSVTLLTATGSITSPVGGMSQPLERRSDNETFHRLLWGGTFLSSADWDIVAEAGFTLVQSYGGDPVIFRQMMDEAGKRGIKMIAGAPYGQERAWLTVGPDVGAANAPDAVYIHVVHHVSQSDPTLILYGDGAPGLAEGIQIRLRDYPTIKELAEHLNHLQLGIRAEILSGKESARSIHLATTWYGNSRSEIITVYGSEINEALYKLYVDTVKNHPALYCFAPFDDPDIRRFSPTFQRHIREKLREWAPSIPVYQLCSDIGLAAGTFEHDHKLAADTYDGMVLYSYPHNWEEVNVYREVDDLRKLLESWRGGHWFSPDKELIMMVSAFSINGPPWTPPPAGAIKRQWEAVQRSGIPLSGFGYYTWTGHEQTLSNDPELRREAADLNQWIADNHTQLTIQIRTNTTTSESIELEFTATLRGGESPVVYNWDFGNGSSAYGKAVTHSFKSGASYEVTVAARTADNQQVEASTFVYSPAHGTALHQDDFSSGSLGAYTAHSGAWTSGDGSLRQTISEAGYARISLDSPARDQYLIEADVTLEAERKRIGIIYSHANEADRYRVEMIPHGSPVFAKEGLTVAARIYTDRGMVEKALTWDWNQRRRLAVHVENSAVHLSIDNTFILSAPKGSNASGSVGFASEGDAGSFDDVRIMSLNTLAINPSATTFGDGNGVSFAANFAGGAAPAQVRWNFGDGSHSTDLNPAHTYSSAGAKHVSLTVTDAAGRTLSKQFNILAGGEKRYREAEDFDWDDNGSRGFPQASEFGVRYAAGKPSIRGRDYYQAVREQGDQAALRANAASLESGASDTGINIGWTSPGDWWSYTFNVASAGAARVAVLGAATQPVALRIYWNDHRVGDVYFRGNGWQDYELAESAVLPVASGEGQLRLQVVNGVGGGSLNIARLVLTLAPGADLDSDAVIDPLDLDIDGDGFLNHDEITGSQSLANDSVSKPTDTDRDFISDLNDGDDDGDGITDSADAAPLTANHPPEIAPIPDQVVRAGELLAIPLVARDYDLPPQSVSVTIANQAPDGMMLGTDSVLRWTPDATYVDETLTVVIRATDNGNTPRSVEQSFQIRINPAQADGFESVQIDTATGPVTLVVPRLRYAFSAKGRTFHIATNGDDTKTGTIGQPWKTFAHALNQLEPGDVLYARAGEYAEPFEVKRSGTISRPIVISAFPGERVRIVQPDEWQNANIDRGTITLQNCAHIWLHGLEVEGGWRRDTPHVAGGGRFGIAVGGAANGVRILNNIISRASDHGILGSWTTEGYLIEGNVIFECGAPFAGAAIQMNIGDHNKIPVIVRGNFAFNCGGGIDLNYSSAVQMYNNVIANVRAVGSTISVAPGNIIAHNVWANNLASGVAIGGNSATNAIVNNVFLNNAGSHLLFADYWGPVDAVALQNQLDYSVFDPASQLASPDEWFRPWLGTNSTIQAPEFIDDEHNDFRLSSTSPGFNARTNVALLGAVSPLHNGIFSATNYWLPWLDAPERIILNEGDQARVPLRTVQEPNTGLLTQFTWATAPPEGAILDLAEAFLKWTPTEADGPGDYSLRVGARAEKSVLLYAETTVEVEVLEVNSAPFVSTPLENLSIVEGVKVTINLGALDFGTSGHGLLREIYNSIPGESLAALTNHASFPDSPTSSGIVRTGFRMPQDVGESYGQRVRGFVVPPTTGDYTFWISGDDNCALYLSMTPYPEDRRQIASVQSWTQPDTWTQEPNQESRAVRLEAGKAYYIEALMKEGGGGDHLAVRWRLPTGAIESPIPSSRLIAWQERPSAYVLDADLPTQRLTFTIMHPVPPGATIHPETGLFEWATTEAHGPGEYRVNIEVEDDGFPIQKTNVAFTITVSEQNIPHTIEPIPARQLEELQTIEFPVRVTDADLPAQKFIYRLVGSVPSGASVNANGIFRWTPDESHGPDTYTFAVEVTDDANPPVKSSVTFGIQVNELNSAPTVAIVPEQVVAEGTPLQLQISGADNDQPRNRLTYKLLSAPETAAIDAQTGMFTWTPAEKDGPGVVAVHFVATDDGQPPLAVTNQFHITVSEVNTPPSLALIEEKRANPGEVIRFQISAADDDIPSQTISYALGTNAPIAAVLDPATGEFSWSVPATEIPGPRQFTVFALDDFAPPARGERSFTITIIPVIHEELVLQLPHVEGNNLIFRWNASGGAAYSLEASESLSLPSWTEVLSATITVEGGVATARDTITTSSRYYRIRRR